MSLSLWSQTTDCRKPESNGEDSEDLEKEILESREDILRSIYDRELNLECQSLNIPPEKSSNEVRTLVLDRSKARYEHWLHAIAGRKVDLTHESVN